ncbi:hypothetical protein [Streptomyces sp. NPDC051173]|uniref:hypothetical protein n=1 Tax=Streptomyces sp. NPDC051173 TaxID=3155164 RepID=UPI00344B32E0
MRPSSRPPVRAGWAAPAGAGCGGLAEPGYGAITLLFGPSTERLCHLTPEHLKFGDKRVHLVLGCHPSCRLHDSPSSCGASPNNPGCGRSFRESTQALGGSSRAWSREEPISTHGMTRKLNRHGIPVRTARHAALAALAADLPSLFLADMTGMHRHTALRWVAYARRDRAEYLAARAEDKSGDIVPAVD